MTRVHAFEIHELERCPPVLRRIATEYLRTVGELFHAFDGFAPLLGALLATSGSKRVVDLCSGAGGPIVSLAARASEHAGFTPEVVLTDLNPVRESLLHASTTASVPVRFEPDPIDARAVPVRLEGVRTMFDAFHHFRPDDAKKILADASTKRVPILIVEGTERSFAAILGMVLFVPLLVLALTPFVRPFSLWRLFFTYVVPVAVPLILFDGIVSCLRSYTLAELRAMTKPLEQDGYRFQVGIKRAHGQRLTYVAGHAGALPDWAG